MSEDTVFSGKNRWFTTGVAVLVLIGLVAAAVGFLWLPRAHGQGAAGLWDAICSAAGAPARFQNAALPSEQAVFPTSVIVTSAMMGAPDARAVGHGATLAQNCTMCHGARGMSAAGTPNLAAQPASATYKQLRDFKSGHRNSVVMQPLVLNLSDEDMRDLAAYYASLPREPLVARAAVALPVPRLASNGSPMRNIGACMSCHSAVAPRAATPILDGLPESYLRLQLQAFRGGGRANDINRQMRNATHLLTPQEVEVLVRYYASR